MGVKVRRTIPGGSQGTAEASPACGAVTPAVQRQPVATGSPAFSSVYSSTNYFLLGSNSQIGGDGEHSPNFHPRVNYFSGFYKKIYPLTQHIPHIHLVCFGRVSLPATAASGGLTLSTGCSATTQSWQAPLTHTRPRCDVLPRSSIFGGDSSCTQTRSRCSLPNTTSLPLPSVLDPAETLQ